MKISTKRRRSLRRPSPAMVVACISLTVALSGTGYAVTALPRNSVGTAQLKANAVKSAKVKNRSLLEVDVKAGQLPASVAGGQKADQVWDFACGVQAVAGSQTVRVSKRSRIWVHGYGTFSGPHGGDYALWLRLRNRADTATVASSAAHWAPKESGETLTLSSGGLLLAGAEPDRPSGAVPFVARPGTYTLQLIAFVTPISESTDCGAASPRFGMNGGNGMSYVVVGAG